MYTVTGATGQFHTLLKILHTSVPGIRGCTVIYLNKALLK